MRKFTSMHSLFLALALALAASPRAGENCHWQGGDSKSDLKKTEIKTEGKAHYQTRFPAISQPELVKAIEAKSVFLVDANGSESYLSGHIPGAVNFEATGMKFADLLPKDKSALIVAYCGGPGCEAWCKAADKLDQMGYTNVRHYKGGIKEWKSAGLEVAKPQNPKG